MVESSGLLNRRRGKPLPGVRIPPSPPVIKILKSSVQLLVIIAGSVVRVRGRVGEVVVKVARNSSRFAPIWFLIRQTREGEAVDMSIHIGAEAALAGPANSNPMQKAVGNLDRAQPALLG